ncbi:MAG: hypothetical protein PHV16_01295 [Candidatus Nanoarchaeia archaeon]|nr:hypothetical protein [Candidatus Nanoarchaeia archaeon]
MFCQPHKKGITRDFLLFLIITVLGFIIIVMVINIFMNRANPEMTESVCRASVLARAKAVFEIKVKGVDVTTVSLLPITCKTQENIKLSGSEDQIMEQISYMSARCWWMFLNGEYKNVFDEHAFFSGKRCFRCYIFTIKEKGIEIKPDELINHMYENNYIDDGEEGVSYLKYIQSYKGDGAVMMREELELKDGDSYVISFVSPDNTFWGKLKDSLFIKMQFWKSGTQKEEEIEMIEMNRILIEQLNALDDKTGEECLTLESI